jgi:hypothetical protein
MVNKFNERFDNIHDEAEVFNEIEHITILT